MPAGGVVFHVRYEEVYQTIGKDEGDQPGTASTGECQFPRGEAEDSEVKGHSVDERGGEDLVVRIDDRATLRSPLCLQQHT